MALHGGTPYTQALDLSPGEIHEFFESTAFAGYRISQEGRQKLALATLTRFDNVMRGISGLGKLLVAIGKVLGKRPRF